MFIFIRKRVFVRHFLFNLFEFFTGNLVQHSSIRSYFVAKTNKIKIFSTIAEEKSTKNNKTSLFSLVLKIKILKAKKKTIESFTNAKVIKCHHALLSLLVLSTGNDKRQSKSKNRQTSPKEKWRNDIISNANVCLLADWIFRRIHQYVKIRENSK